MQVLEKILEEIKEATFQEDAPIYLGDMEVDGYVRESVVKEIISSHMNEVNNDWIPCSEQLPEESGHYRVTVKNITEEITEQTAYFTEGQWRELYKCEQVIAWRKMQPYIPESLAAGIDL